VALDVLKSSVLLELGQQPRVQDAAVAKLDQVLSLGLAEGDVVGDKNPRASRSQLAIQALLEDVAANMGVDSTKDIVHNEDSGS
jgi:hypothetical protein